MLPDGYKETEIGVLPVEWDIKRLSEIGLFSKGKGISKNEVIKEGIPCIRYAEIYTEYDTLLKNIKSFINKKSALNSKQLNKGDILFAGSGETLDDIGKSVAFIDDFEAYVGGDTVILSPSIDYNSLFMSYQLNSTVVRLQLRKLGQGSSVVHIYSSGLEKVKVYFPPLKEQQKIAQILSTTDEKIKAISSQIKKAETVKKGLLQKLLSEGIGHSEFKESELGRIPESWEVLRLNTLCEFISVGIATSTSKHCVKNSGVPLIRNQNILENKFDLEDLLYISESFDAENINKRIKENDILIVRTGYPGISAVVTKEMTNWQTFTTLIARPKHNIVLSKYISYFINSHIGKNIIQGLQAGGAQKNLNVASINKLLIILPSLKEQTQIAQILSTSDEKIELLKAKKEKYEILKKGLLQKLLTGAIRV